MKKIICISTICLALLIATRGEVFAARLLLDSPTDASTNGEPFAVTVSLDSEGIKLSAVAGALSFDSNLLEIESIITRGSLVSLWVTQPKVANTYVEGARTIIPFEGIMPGGYSGVRSPYYSGVRPGEVFIVTLKPKKEGTATVLLDAIELHAFDSNGTMIRGDAIVSHVSVPNQSIIYSPVTRELTRTESNTLNVLIDRDMLIADNKWYLSVAEDESVRTIGKIYIAESNEYDITKIKDGDWKEVETTYVLQSQSRSKYVHVKIIYENNTYTLRTLPPVENSKDILYPSRILIGIVFLVLVLYRYGKKSKTHFFKFFSKIKK